MPTQVSFTADPVLKRRAARKAKQEGISLKTLFVYTMKGFVDGRISLGIETDANGDVEEWTVTDPNIQAKAKKIATLLHSRHASAR